MYEISAGWQEYYSEPEPQRRLKIRDELCACEPDDGANAFRERLYELRYVDPKNPGSLVDRFLWSCVNFPEIYKSSRLFKRGAVRETKKALKTMGFDEYASYGSAGESALYWEVRNTAKRYFKTSENPAYRRKLFGLMGASEEERSVQLMKDVWLMTTAVSEHLRMEQEMRIWCTAIKDEYASLDDEAGKRLADFEAEKRKH